MGRIAFWGALFAGLAMMAAPIAFPMDTGPATLLFLVGLIGFLGCSAWHGLNWKKRRTMKNPHGPKSAGIYIGGNMKGWTIEGNTFIGGDAAVHVEGDAEDNTFVGNRHFRPRAQGVPKPELDRLKAVLQAITNEYRGIHSEMPDEPTLNRLLGERGEAWRIRHLGGDDWETFLP